MQFDSFNNIPNPPPSTTNPNIFGGLTIEDQVNEAKLRAQIYADSIRIAKEKETRTIAALEAEKNQWIESYEKKSLLVNQLERELASAVEMLNLQRQSQNHGLGSMSQPKVLDDRVIQENMKTFLGQSKSFDACDVMRSKGSAINNLSDSVGHSRVDTTSKISQDPSSENAELRQKLSCLSAELEQFKLSRDDLSAKLQFRMSQISEFEHEKLAQKNDMQSLRDKIEELEAKLYSSEMHCRVVSNENERYVNDIKRLEERLNDPHQQLYVRTLENNVTNLQHQIQDLNNRITAKDESHASELQQLKQIIQSLQLRLRQSSSHGGIVVEPPSFMHHRVVPQSIAPFTTTGPSIMSPIVNRSDQSAAPSLSSDSGAETLLRDTPSALHTIAHAAAIPETPVVADPTELPHGSSRQPTHGAEDTRAQDQGHSAARDASAIDHPRSRANSEGSLGSQGSQASLHSSQAPTPRVTTDMLSLRDPRIYSSAVSRPVHFPPPDEEEERQEDELRESVSHSESKAKKGTKKFKAVSQPATKKRSSSTPRTSKSAEKDHKTTPKPISSQRPSSEERPRGALSSHNSHTLHTPQSAKSRRKTISEERSLKTPTSTKAAAVTPSTMPKDTPRTKRGTQPDTPAAVGHLSTLLVDGKERRLLQVVLPSSKDHAVTSGEPARQAASNTHAADNSNAVRKSQEKSSNGHSSLPVDPELHDQSLVSLSTIGSHRQSHSNRTPNQKQDSASKKALSFSAYKARLASSPAPASSPVSGGKALKVSSGSKPLSRPTNSSLRRIVSP